MKPKIFKNLIFKDKRGLFQELFLEKKIKKKIKFSAYSFSKKNVIRGLHYQYKKPQSKIVTVLEGKCLDVCININPRSKYFKKIFKFLLEPGKILFIPVDYAHGFGVLSKSLHMIYHFTEYRYPKFESGILYNDPALNIRWGIKNPIISLKDKKFPLFKDRKY